MPILRMPSWPAGSCGEADVLRRARPFEWCRRASSVAAAARWDWNLSRVPAGLTIPFGCAIGQVRQELR